MDNSTQTENLQQQTTGKDFGGGPNAQRGDGDGLAQKVYSENNKEGLSHALGEGDTAAETSVVSENNNAGAGSAGGPATQNVSTSNTGEQESAGTGEGGQDEFPAHYTDEDKQKPWLNPNAGSTDNSL